MMTYRDLMAAKADRTPNWNKWRLIPKPMLWQCVALWLGIDPDKVDIDDASWMVGHTVFNESQEFQNRLDVACANVGKDGALRPTDYAAHPQSYSVSLREFAAWVQKIGWEAPAEFLALAMADEDAAIKNNLTPGDKRTGAATARRSAGRTGRLEDLRRFVNDIYTAAEHEGLVLEDDNGHKPLPFRGEDLHTLFLVRYPDHKVALATFTDDLGQIGVAVKPGQKRCELSYLAELLAGKFSG